jgi:hypothetical protein
MEKHAYPSTLRAAATAPLRNAPGRIRPPFDLRSDGPADDYEPGETAGQWRARRHADRLAALQEPLDGVELGAHDRRILDWLADWDTSVIGTVASLLYRAREAGAENAAGGK